MREGALLLFRPLRGLLGAYLGQPSFPRAGIIVSTQRDLHVQRFTAAHELGHMVMGHEPSLDGEEIGLWRGESSNPQEVEADAFASEFYSRDGSTFITRVATGGPVQRWNGQTSHINFRLDWVRVTTQPAGDCRATTSSREPPPTHFAPTNQRCSNRRRLPAKGDCRTRGRMFGSSLRRTTG